MRYSRVNTVVTRAEYVFRPAADSTSLDDHGDNGKKTNKSRSSIAFRLICTCRVARWMDGPWMENGKEYLVTDFQRSVKIEYRNVPGKWEGGKVQVGGGANQQASEAEGK